MGAVVAAVGLGAGFEIRGGVSQPGARVEWKGARVKDYHALHLRGVAWAILAELTGAGYFRGACYLLAALHLGLSLLCLFKEKEGRA